LELLQPAGKLFLSDGKDIYFYSPNANRVEKMKLKEAKTYARRSPSCWAGSISSATSRMPVSRLGRWPLDHRQPQSDRLPYKEVEFLSCLHTKSASSR